MTVLQRIADPARILLHKSKLQYSLCSEVVALDIATQKMFFAVTFLSMHYEAFERMGARMPKTGTVPIHFELLEKPGPIRLRLMDGLYWLNGRSILIEHFELITGSRLTGNDELSVTAKVTQLEKITGGVQHRREYLVFGDLGHYS